MEEIKYLFVGESPYYADTPKNSRMYYNIKPKSDYPTELVAFFPEYQNGNTGKLFEIVTYKRILGVLYNERIKKIDEDQYLSPIQIVELWKDKGIYFCNLSELKDLINIDNDKFLTIENKCTNKKWKVTSNTKILCFGKQAIKHFNSRKYRKYDFKNIGTFPHPSTDSFVFWQYYDNEFEPYIHNLNINLFPTL